MACWILAHQIDLECKIGRERYLLFLRYLRYFFYFKYNICIRQLHGTPRAMQMSEWYIRTHKMTLVAKISSHKDSMTLITQLFCNNIKKIKCTEDTEHDLKLLICFLLISCFSLLWSFCPGSLTKTSSPGASLQTVRVIQLMKKLTRAKPSGNLVVVVPWPGSESIRFCWDFTRQTQYSSHKKRTITPKTGHTDLKSRNSYKWPTWDLILEENRWGKVY